MILKKGTSGPWTWYEFMCPGCNKLHPFHTENPRGVIWTFNGNLEKPTFTPSLMVDKDTPKQCHLNMTDGMIYFHPDSKHALAGQTVPIPELPEPTAGNTPESDS